MVFVREGGICLECYCESEAGGMRDEGACSSHSEQTRTA